MCLRARVCVREREREREKERERERERKKRMREKGSVDQILQLFLPLRSEGFH